MTLFIEPGSPWEKGDIESFNGRLRDELLNGEIFDTVREARVENVMNLGFVSHTRILHYEAPYGEETRSDRPCSAG